MNTANDGVAALPRLRNVGSFVDQRLSGLQKRHANGDSSARAQLAQLRRALGKPVGSVPEVWQITLEGVPIPADWNSDKPSANEKAAHAAMTLYASHQQSLKRPMHARGHMLGSSARALEFREKASEDALWRRFNMVATADSFDEVCYHLRGIVSLLRSADPGIPLDYGALADDLVSYQFLEGRDRVRLKWARQYYATKQSSDDTNSIDQEK